MNLAKENPNIEAAHSLSAKAGGMPPLKHLWPIPALVLSTGLFVGGLIMAVSSRPKPDAGPALSKAKAQVDEKKFEDAIATLNNEARPLVDNGVTTPVQQREYYLTRARAFSGAQETLGFSREENHRQIVADYERYEKSGGELEVPDVSRLASSLIALDMVDDALARVTRLPEAESARRMRLWRKVVEHNLGESELLVTAVKPVEGAEKDGHDAHAAKDKAGAEGGHADSKGMDAGHGGSSRAAPAHASAEPAASVAPALAPGPAGKKRLDQTLDLLASMANAPGVESEESAWVLTKQAELLIHAGKFEEAGEKIVRRLSKFADVSAVQQGELRLLLGRAYFMADEPANAGKHLEAALAYLPEGNPLRADAGVMLGRLAQGQGNLDRAKELYEQVQREHSASKAVGRALLGIAEVSAAGRDDAEARRVSLETYAELVEKMTAEGGRAGDVTPEVVTRSLMQRFDERFDSGRKEDALRFAQMAEGLYKDDRVPAPVLLAIGKTRRGLADETLEQAKAGKDADFGVQDLDQTTRVEVKQNYLQAGEYLRKHAGATVLTEGVMSGDSLWQSADSFDRAGDMEEARKGFAQYADGAPDNDPRKHAAKFRLAQVLQAQRDYTAAAAVYGELVETRTRGGLLAQAGVWGERSIVPLAQCLLSDTSASNDAEAEKLLLSVVDGSILTPDAAAYRDALIEMGTMYSGAGKFAQAIGRLEQAVERYPDDRRIETARFRLADSHRQEAAEIKKTLEAGALPLSQQDELRAGRSEHLKTGKALFEQVRSNLETKDRRKMTRLEQTYLRNAQFYAGDCAFELGDYEAAIEAYDAARLRYTDDPASLVAMVQIVAAYAAQGRMSEARTANERARQQLARFPEDVWSNPDLPMERKHWERWLDARMVLETADQKAQGGDR